MKRSEFFKRLGLGLVAIPLAPAVAAEIMEMVQEDFPIPKSSHIENFIPDKDPTYSLEYCQKIYKETGNLLYSSMEKPEINDELVRRYMAGEQDFVEYLRKLNS